jgi:hypothetical protein
MFLDLGNGRSAPLTKGEDQWYEYRSRSTESFAFSAVALNKFNLENKNKPACRVSVYEDLPPSVKVVTPNDELTVLPDEKVNVTFEASDDFGVAKAEVIVTTTQADGETKAVTLPVNLEGDEGKKQMRKSVQLDPAALGLKHGDQLTYVVKVTDTKQSPAEAGAESSAKLASAEAQSKDQPEIAPKSDGANQSSEGSGKDGKPSEQDSADSSSLLAKASDQKQDQKPNDGSQPPPNEMSKRMLDAGQCSSCKALRVTVDEWAGTFEGEKRQKLEIAIAPVLEKLDKLLKMADAKT